jgi:hypothetical protein
VSVLDEIIAERDATRTAQDEEYSADRWARALRGLIGFGYRGRDVWIKIGGLALRAAEAIDRRPS